MTPTDFEIRELQPGEEEAVADLVMGVFMGYVGHEYSDEGVAEFARFASADALRKRCEAGESMVWVARVGESLAGMLEFRGADHVSLMFVAEAYHGHGIATRLFDTARAQLNTGEITVNSSSHAVPVYKRLGFATEGPEQTVNGITFVPMFRPAG